MVLSSLWNQKNASVHYQDLWKGLWPLTGTSTVLHLSEDREKGLGQFHLWLDEWGQLTKHRPVSEHLPTWWPVSGQSRLRPSEWQVTQGERGTKHEVLRSCPKPPKSLSFFPKTVIFWSATIPKSLPSLWGTDYLSSSQTFPSKSWCNTSTWPLKKSERLHWSDHQLF